MSTLWIAFLVLAAAPSEGQQAATVAQPSAATVEKPRATPRKGYELRDAIRAALRRWARPADADAQKAAREFLALYSELQADDQLARSQKEQLRIQLRSRLGQLSDQISAQIVRQKRLANSPRPKSVGAPDQKAGPLAQQWGGGMGGAGRMMGAGGMGMGLGGGLGQGGFGGQWGPEDRGQELVDLIQRVIAPQSWDINGGPGSIYYWSPGRALVIRQTQEVHEEIGGVLEQMGRMGR